MNRLSITDLRAQADSALGNHSPTPSPAELRQVHRDHLVNGATAATNTVRALGRKVAQDYTLETAVQNGQPPFPHTGNILLSVLTCGLWLPVYWGNWMVSKRRRYQQARRAELRAHGIS
jgi:hypothetical protein